MQLFRSQLSRFSPHPHRDSWMRNNLKQWLKLLQWATFFTLIAAGWLTAKHHSPLGDIYKLDENLATWLSLPVNLVDYIMLGIGIFFFISSLCAFRCGNYYKVKYIVLVFTSGLLIAVTLVLYTLESGKMAMAPATFILPVATPFLLLRYQVWKNQVDHWSIVACMLIAFTFGSYAYQSITIPAGIPTSSGNPVVISHFSADLNALIAESSAYIAIGSVLALFITSLRRIALYICIILAIIISGATFFSYTASHQPWLNASESIPMTLLIISYWIIPILILLSLASQRKSKTLRL